MQLSSKVKSSWDVRRGYRTNQKISLYYLQESRYSCLLNQHAVITVHLHTPKGAQRGNGKKGTPNNTLPDCSQAHHRSHSKVHLHKPRGTQWQARTRTRASQGADTPSRSFPGSQETLSPCVQARSPSRQSSGGALWITFWTKAGGLLPRGVGHVMGCQEKQFGIAQDL